MQLGGKIRLTLKYYFLPYGIMVLQLQTQQKCVWNREKGKVYADS